MVVTDTVVPLEVGFTLPEVLNTASQVVTWFGPIPLMVIAVSLGIGATVLVIRWVRSAIPTA